MYLLVWFDDVIMTSPALLSDVEHTSSWLLAIRVGVALIGLGGVNLVILMVSPKVISTFPLLPNTIPYSKLVLLLSWQGFFNLAVFF